MLVARPAGVYHGHLIKGMVWLTSPKPATHFRQSRDNLANGPMGSWRFRTGPDHERMEVRCDC